MNRSHNLHMVIVFLAISFLSGACAEELTAPELFDAVNLGKLDTVQSYLENGGDVGKIIQHDVFRGTLLHASLWRRQDDISALLLTSGADINLKTGKAHALDFAAQGGIYETASTILKLYPDSLQNSDAIVLAADQGFYDIVKLFLDHNQEPRTRIKEQMDRALFATATRGHEDVARLLLESGATPSASVLISASWGSSPSIVRELLRRGVSPNEIVEDQTALDSAIRRLERHGPVQSSRNILWELVQAGADVCLLSNAKGELKTATLNEMFKVDQECGWIGEEMERRHEERIAKANKHQSDQENP